MFQIIGPAIAAISLVGAYAAAWRIYRTAWNSKSRGRARPHDRARTKA